ncbi:MAG: mandelate racemase/muconate lactonizing enzyme family protein [Christensenellales bacterium]|jgi:L-alanine-DL-glutamate epimerase-like enolase superfamily enzyme
MKITGLRTYFSEICHYVLIDTDEGITGLGEATLHTRQTAVDAVLRQLESVITGQDPMRTEFIWQDIFRGTFWRGGPVLMSALSGIDMALWDIKGKALNTPVYNLLGGKSRDRIQLYTGVFGRSDEEVAENALRLVEKGYKILRICASDYVPGGVTDPWEQVRRAEKQVTAVRKAVGEEINIIVENHTRFTPATAVDLAKRLEPLHIFFIEDPIRSDSPEMFRNLRRQTSIPLGTGEKFGTIWDYRCLIEEDLIDYLRTDICNGGGISGMMKVAHYGEVHYMEMVPHGVHHAAFIAACHVNFAVHNFCCQEDWISRGRPEWLDYDVEIKDGYLTMGDRPGIGVEIDLNALKPFQFREHPHRRRPDGSVQDW